MDLLDVAGPGVFGAEVFAAILALEGGNLPLRRVLELDVVGHLLVTGGLEIARPAGVDGASLRGQEVAPHPVVEDPLLADRRVCAKVAPIPLAPVHQVAVLLERPGTGQRLAAQATVVRGLLVGPCPPNRL